jgi:hypothetical protein
MDRTTSKWEHYPAAKLDALDTSGRRKPRKYVGRTTGMGVEQYQDYLVYQRRQGRACRPASD